ncbi:hypothetical protein BZA77DRAFT_252527 [Pyronema omphalodes]|nr:hypothetical protein BZA77DRAFT_252527 [Pyronema omphalodes]
MTAPVDRPNLGRAASETNLNGEGQANSDSSTDNGSDLNREVAALSNKLISAINHQTKLDDSLAATKHELELSKARIRQLEATAKEHADMMAKGLLVEKKDVEDETARLMNRLKAESMQRGQAEKDKRQIEQELENLTTALFDEAHKMVSAAHKERDAVQRKNEQLKAQVMDTESLLASHQEQLAELKEVIAQMTQEREEREGAIPGTPRTPGLSRRRSRASLVQIFDALNLSGSDEMPPCPPTSLINLVHPVLRHDTASYKDFCELFCQPKPVEFQKTHPAGRVSGGSFTSIQLMGVGLSMPSPGQSMFGRKRVESGSTTHSPANSTSGGSMDSQNHLAALKESKFFKRVMLEDVEPTLRLDCAPGLSWLARRNVLSAITDGSLVIDPMPSSPKVTIFACALCGENKADEQHARTHRMRTSESPNAQRYPLCWYCTNRLRSVCDFMAFLRTLREGLWKCEGEGDQKHAWEESVKLREAMFWARIGGGVIFSVHSPAFREFRDETLTNGQTETPPRTPMMPNMADQGKLTIPKKRRSQNNPFLTPERQITRGGLRIPSPLDLSAPNMSDTDDSSTNGTIFIERATDSEKEEYGQPYDSSEELATVIEIDNEKQPDTPVSASPIILGQEQEDHDEHDLPPHAEDIPLPESRPTSQAISLRSPIIITQDIPKPPQVLSPTPIEPPASPQIPGGW